MGVVADQRDPTFVVMRIQQRRLVVIELLDLVLRLLEMVPGRSVKFALEGEPPATLDLRLDVGDNPAQSRVSLTLEVARVPSILLTAVMGTLLAGDMARLKAALER